MVFFMDFQHYRSARPEIAEQKRLRAILVVSGENGLGEPPLSVLIGILFIDLYHSCAWKVMPPPVRVVRLAFLK